MKPYKTYFCCVLQAPLVEPFSRFLCHGFRNLAIFVIDWLSGLSIPYSLQAVIATALSELPVVLVIAILRLFVAFRESSLLVVDMNVTSEPLKILSGNIIPVL